MNTGLIKNNQYLCRLFWKICIAKKLRSFQYIAGKKPLTDGTSTLAVVRHGSVWRPNDKAISNVEILNGFQKNIEADSKIGRVKNITSHFSRLKYKKADCLSFEQTGVDSVSDKALQILNDGLICLHPNIAYHFIWMALSYRSPKNIVRSYLASDKTLFFDSLNFK